MQVSAVRFRKIFSYAAIILFLVFVADLFAKRFYFVDGHHDFTAYYSAVKLVEKGKSPYDPVELNRQMGLPADDLPFTYNYLPATLNCFKPFAQFDLITAKRIFLFVKFFFFAGLVLIWGKIFALSENSWIERRIFSFKNFPRDPVFYLLLIFAFHRALRLDVRAGNITIIEQFFLWSGLYLLLREKNFFSGILMTLGGLWKISPLAFLIFLPVQNKKIGWRNFFLFCGIIGIVIAGEFLFEPKLIHEFIANLRWISQMDYTKFESPVVTPSASNFIFLNFSPEIRPVVKTIFTLLIGAPGIFAFYKVRNFPSKEKIFLWFLLGTLLYILLMPVRIKDYTYIMAIPAAYFAVRKLLPNVVLQCAVTVLIMLHLTDFHSLWSALLVYEIILWGIFSQKEIFSSEKKFFHQSDRSEHCLNAAFVSK